MPRSKFSLGRLLTPDSTVDEVDSSPQEQATQRHEETTRGEPPRPFATTPPPLPPDERPPAYEPRIARRDYENESIEPAQPELHQGTSEAMSEFSESVVRQRARKKPRPRGRGEYEKVTLNLSTDLVNFVEAARRSHMRPSGEYSTVRSHFIEDLIAAERDRRAARPLNS